ncbi:MAG: CaiB/BaiF CoA-transferase family protein [Syntrophomonas sp.]|nr:CaiB/BaiF CoA-transferase family protein [Syntrophomonas sp.]
MSMPLEGIKILDLTTMLPAYCSMTLGDYGAEVIKIEQPGTGDSSRRVKPLINDTNGRFLILNRNKKSLTLNLKTEKGKEIFYCLAGEADVIIEQFRPGVARKLGIDYDTIKDINPRLVYCSITGYGQDGPYAFVAGHDINYLSYAGILGMTGKKGDDPAIPGIQVADMCGGILMAVNGILLALMARHKTGQGQYIDIAMLDGVLSCHTIAAGDYFTSGAIPGPETTRLNGKYACYSVYKTKDGKFISMGALEPHFWRRICEFFGKEEYITIQMDDGKQEEIFAFLAEQFSLRERDEWMSVLRDLDACIAPVYSMNEVFEDPQVIHRKMAFESEHPRLGAIKQLGFPIKMSATPARFNMAAPELGQHNQEILAGIGYNADEIKSLKQQGAI